MTTKVRSSTLVSVANTQISGLITSAQIATVANTQITGNIVSSQITSVSNTQITGLITSSQIANISNTQIVGTVGSNSLNTTHYTIQESGGKLVIKYGSTTIMSIDSSGNIISANNVTAAGTP